jgi:hypothetical protein
MRTCHNPQRIYKPLASCSHQMEFGGKKRRLVLFLIGRDRWKRMMDECCGQAIHSSFGEYRLQFGDFQNADTRTFKATPVVCG